MILSDRTKTGIPKLYFTEGDILQIDCLDEQLTLMAVNKINKCDSCFFRTSCSLELQDKCGKIIFAQIKK